MVLKDTQEILFLIAKDFVELSPLQQINVGIKLKLVGIEVGMEKVENIASIIFTKAYQRGKLPELVKEMRPFIYEQS